MRWLRYRLEKRFEKSNWEIKILRKWFECMHHVNVKWFLARLKNMHTQIISKTGTESECERICLLVSTKINVLVYKIEKIRWNKWFLSIIINQRQWFRISMFEINTSGRRKICILCKLEQPKHVWCWCACYHDNTLVFFFSIFPTIYSIFDFVAHRTAKTVEKSEDPCSFMRANSCFPPEVWIPN